MNIQAICFDMDGVIIDSEPAHHQAFKTILYENGIELSDDDYQSFFAGKKGSEAMHDFLTAKKSTLSSATVLQQKLDWYMKNAAPTIQGNDSTISSIKVLSSRYPLALVTSSPPDLVALMLEKFDIAADFTVLVTAADVSYGKPHPESYMLAAQRLGVRPSNCLVIEDAPSGVTAANTAGMKSIALTTTHDASELSTATHITDVLTLDSFEDFINSTAQHS